MDDAEILDTCYFYNEIQFLNRLLEGRYKSLTRAPQKDRERRSHQRAAIFELINILLGDGHATDTFFDRFNTAYPDATLAERMVNILLTLLVDYDTMKKNAATKKMNDIYTTYLLTYAYILRYYDDYPKED